MTDDDARSWMAHCYSECVIAKLEWFAAQLSTANKTQNLVAASTISTMWTRHFLDSAQLIDLAQSNWTHWVDVGSGAGLPGLIVAILTPDRAVTLIEPRRLRAEFLRKCCIGLELDKLTVVQSKAANADIADIADVVSARAVGTLDVLLDHSRHFTDRSTKFILPRGKHAEFDVATARHSWHGSFHVKQSIVDPQSGIVVATGVSRR